MTVFEDSSRVLAERRTSKPVRPVAWNTELTNGSFAEARSAAADR